MTYDGRRMQQLQTEIDVLEAGLSRVQERTRKFHSPAEVRFERYQLRVSAAGEGVMKHTCECMMRAIAKGEGRPSNFQIRSYFQALCSTAVLGQRPTLEEFENLQTAYRQTIKPAGALK